MGPDGKRWEYKPGRNSMLKVGRVYSKPLRFDVVIELRACLCANPIFAARPPGGACALRRQFFQAGLLGALRQRVQWMCASGKAVVARIFG